MQDPLPLNNKPFDVRIWKRLVFTIFYTNGGLFTKVLNSFSFSPKKKLCTKWLLLIAQIDIFEISCTRVFTQNNKALPWGKSKFFSSANNLAHRDAFTAISKVTYFYPSFYRQKCSLPLHILTLNNKRSWARTTSKIKLDNP